MNELYHFSFGKGSERKNHKYIARVPEGKRFRYFYTQAQYQAYKLGNSVSKGASDLAKGIQNTTSNAGRFVQKSAANASRKVNRFVDDKITGKGAMQRRRLETSIISDNLAKANKTKNSEASNFYYQQVGKHAERQKEAIKKYNGSLAGKVNSLKTSAKIKFNNAKHDAKTKIDNTKHDVKTKISDAKLNAKQSAKTASEKLQKNLSDYFGKGNPYNSNPSNYKKVREAIQSTQEWKDIVNRKDPEYTTRNSDGSYSYNYDKYLTNKKHPIIDALTDIGEYRAVSVNKMSVKALTAGAVDYAKMGRSTVETLMTIGVGLLTLKIRNQQGSNANFIEEQKSSETRNASLKNFAKSNGIDIDEMIDVYDSIKSGDYQEAAKKAASSSTVKEFASKNGISTKDVVNAISKTKNGNYEEALNDILDNDKVRDIAKKNGVDIDDAKTVASKVAAGKYEEAAKAAVASKTTDVAAGKIVSQIALKKASEKTGYSEAQIKNFIKSYTDMTGSSPEEALEYFMTTIKR